MAPTESTHRNGAAPRLLLEFARWAHKCFPVAHLRTANWILQANRGRDFPVSFPLFGYRMQLDANRSPVHAMLYLKREDFVEDAAVLAPYLKPGMTVLDVGANIGYLTYFCCLGVEPGGRVFSFEPDAANFSELATNVERNGITFCHPLQVAVGARDGAVCFAAGLNGHIDIESASQPDCPMISLDSFVEQRSIPQVDLVKIDVEGWELDVLQGMQRILTREHKPILYVEVHPRGFLGRGDPEKVCCFLQGYYPNVIAFRTWSDARGNLSAWRRLELSLFRGAGHPQPVSLGELKQNQHERFQLLCLPEDKWDAGELAPST